MSKAGIQTVRGQGALGFAARRSSLRPAAIRNGNRNKLFAEDRAPHDWYRFVLSFPPQLVRQYILDFGVRPGQTVLDPFCGTGTTLVECKKAEIASVGLEAHPMCAFASAVKTDWALDGTLLARHARRIARTAKGELDR